MDNGFTGINLEHLKGQANTVETILTTAIFGYEKKLYLFFEKLRKYWASKNAYNFGISATTLINERIKKMKDFINELLDDIDISLQNYIYTLGLNGRVSINRCASHIDRTYILDEKNHNGISGMNIPLVEDLLSNDLQSYKSGILDWLDELPSNLSFYDADGEQQNAYTTRVQFIKNSVEELATELETQIRSNIETEKNNILLAKQQVVQNMNGGSNTKNA